MAILVADSVFRISNLAAEFSPNDAAKASPKTPALLFGELLTVGKTAARILVSLQRDGCSTANEKPRLDPSNVRVERQISSIPDIVWSLCTAAFVEVSAIDFRPSFVTLPARSTCDDDDNFLRIMLSRDAWFSVDLRGFGKVD
ncbi:MAG: hypothetical protein HYS06_02925 [Methylocystis sp.]|nr:hypothetical protein [Methylocystis sp.]